MSKQARALNPAGGGDMSEEGAENTPEVYVSTGMGTRKRRAPRGGGGGTMAAAPLGKGAVEAEDGDGAGASAGAGVGGCQGEEVCSWRKRTTPAASAGASASQHPTETGFESHTVVHLPTATPRDCSAVTELTGYTYTSVSRGAAFKLGAALMCGGDLFKRDSERKIMEEDGVLEKLRRSGHMETRAVLSKAYGLVGFLYEDCKGLKSKHKDKMPTTVDSRGVLRLCEHEGTQHAILTTGTVFEQKKVYAVGFVGSGAYSGLKTTFNEQEHAVTAPQGGSTISVIVTLQNKDHKAFMCELVRAVEADAESLGGDSSSAWDPPATITERCPSGYSLKQKAKGGTFTSSSAAQPLPPAHAPRTHSRTHTRTRCALSLSSPHTHTHSHVLQVTLPPSATTSCASASPLHLHLRSARAS